MCVSVSNENRETGCDFTFTILLILFVIVSVLVGNELRDENCTHVLLHLPLITFHWIIDFPDTDYDNMLVLVG